MQRKGINQLQELQGKCESKRAVLPPRGKGSMWSMIQWLPFFLKFSNCDKLLRLHPLFKKSCVINSEALARDLTSTHRQTERKAFSSLDSLSGFLRRGVPLVAMRYSAFSGSSFRYGGSDSIISIAIIPRDQISTLLPYSFCLTTSGAIQYGVPTMVARLLRVSVSLALKPKSAVHG